MQLVPNLSLTSSISGRAGGAPPAGGGYVPRFNGYLPVVPNWNVGLVLQWQLDPVQLARATAQSVRATAAELERADTEIATRQGAREAHQRAVLAEKALPALQRALDAAKVNQDQAETRFKNGLGTILDVSDAEVLRTDAELQLVLGRFELATARARLARILSRTL
jgi:outer membrane protein